MRVDPGVIERDVVGDEVDQQAELAAVHSLAQPGQRRIAAEVAMDVVADDRERRPDDVGLAEVGQIVLQVGAARRRACALLSGQARLPEPSIQIQRNPRAAARSNRASGRSSSVDGRSRAAAVSPRSSRGLI